jgi:hypothetical protein
LCCAPLHSSLQQLIESGANNAVSNHTTKRPFARSACLIGNVTNLDFAEPLPEAGANQMPRPSGEGHTIDVYHAGVPEPNFAELALPRDANITT